MKVDTFERALHRWQPWLDSINKGRRLLIPPYSHLTAGKMMEITRAELTQLRFPDGFQLELYWLCCVFSDYWTKIGFKFDKLILPDWFPSPYGQYDIQLQRGQRVHPPSLWSETDKKFLFSKDTLIGVLLDAQPEKREELYRDWPGPDYVLVLPNDHPVLQSIKRGHPTRMTRSGETLLD